MRSVTRREDLTDVGAQIGFRSDDGRRAVGQHDDAIEEEAVLGEDRLIADAEVGVRQHRQDLVGAGAANDAVGVQPVAGRDRSPQ